MFFIYGFFELSPVLLNTVPTLAMLVAVAYNEDCFYPMACVLRPRGGGLLSGLPLFLLGIGGLRGDERHVLDDGGARTRRFRHAAHEELAGGRRAPVQRPRPAVLADSLAVRGDPLLHRGTPIRVSGHESSNYRQMWGGFRCRLLPCSRKLVPSSYKHHGDPPAIVQLNQLPRRLRFIDDVIIKCVVFQVAFRYVRIDIPGWCIESLRYSSYNRLARIRSSLQL